MCIRRNHIHNNTCSWPLEHNGCSIYHMEPKVEANPHGIQSWYKLMSIALHYAHVGREVGGEQCQMATWSSKTHIISFDHCCTIHVGTPL
jgi:hypothetical protein